MVKKIDIKAAVLDSGDTVSVQILKYVDGALSEDNTYTFDANGFEAARASSNTYVAKLVFGDAHTEQIDGSTTQCYFDGTVCSPNNAYTLAGLVEADVTAYASGGGGGGGYTFPANHGNTAYVSSDGNNGTGAVGNISKPFLNVQDAIEALNDGVPGTVVILSSTGEQIISDLDVYNNDCPQELRIKNLTNCDIAFEGTIAFLSLFLHSLGPVIIRTDMGFAADDYAQIDCSALTISDDAEGTVTMASSDINCAIFNMPANGNVDVVLDCLKWTKAVSVEAVNSFTYNKINPMRWSTKLNQADSAAPTDIGVIFENDYGETMTYSRTDVGTYKITSPGSKFDPDYTVFTYSQPDAQAAGGACEFQQGTTTTDYVTIITLDAFMSYADSILSKNYVMIETYLKKY